jgi:hypothetical protein
MVAPASTAFWPNDKHALECPIEKIIFLDVSSGIRDIILPNSGAAVIFLIVDPLLRFSAP